MPNVKRLSVLFQNKANHEGVITTPNSKITAMIVPTNEELMIARDVVRLTNID